MKLAAGSMVKGSCVRQVLTMSIAAVCILGTFAGCATREKVVVHETVVAQPVVRKMPAPIREDEGRAPGADWNWVPGHWKWEGNNWFWVHGRWIEQAVAPMPPIIVERMTVAPSPRHYWVPGHWVWQYNGHGGWVWIKGAWRV